MRRVPFIAALLSGAVIAVAAQAAQPTGSPQTRAEQACAQHGVQPRSSAWELCLSQVTRAYEWGESTLASQLARAAGDARETCLEHGLRPDTGAYRACINKEIDARSDLLILGDDQSGVNVAASQ
ncbi:MAG TPA: hypothetical protein VFE12_08660 [Acetobacteraceae bacterium]|nr:hypothetical protein [Acetobacteraceae bacterium]